METIVIEYNKDNKTCTITHKERNISHFYDLYCFNVVDCLTDFINEFLED